MNDDIFKIKPTKNAVIENDDKFIIYSETEIMQKLRMLQKNKCIITAYFDDGKQSLLTAVIDILPAKKMLLLDFGPNDTVNKALLSSHHVIFKSSLDGVSAKFTAQKVQKAKYQGEQVFACQVPEDLLWVQRRDTYRVRIPMGIDASCLIYFENKAVQYRVHDISVGGLALEDPENNQEFALGNLLERCEITLGDHGTGNVNLEVRSHFPPGKDNPKAERRIGCLFVDLRSDVDAMIQRFIHAIDSNRRKLEDH